MRDAMTFSPIIIAILTDIRKIPAAHPVPSYYTIAIRPSTTIITTVIPEASATRRYRALVPGSARPITGLHAPAAASTHTQTSAAARAGVAARIPAIHTGTARATGRRPAVPTGIRTTATGQEAAGASRGSAMKPYHAEAAGGCAAARAPSRTAITAMSTAALHHLHITARSLVAA